MEFVAEANHVRHGNHEKAPALDFFRLLEFLVFSFDDIIVSIEIIFLELDFTFLEVHFKRFNLVLHSAMKRLRCSVLAFYH